MHNKIIKLPTKKPAEPRRTSIYNLPAQLTPLIGREQEVAATCSLLRRPEVRFVTLIGTGGVGKTRLALQVATDLVDDFADGIFFIPLAPISNPGLVVPTIAQALGLKDTGSQLSLDFLKTYLSEKHLLLLLDNFEQVVAVAPRLSELAAECLHLKILVTSRAVLHLRGEHEFPVPPLALPDLTQLPESKTLSQVAAVALFLQRARAVKPDLQMTPVNAHAIAKICVQLDGLPLAIELAAARSKLLPPQALFARLDKPLAVLTSRAQDVPTRQQTLRNTMAWSYNLLGTGDQQLFRRLSVFVGGCTLQTIEAVYAALGEEVEPILSGAASLIDNSLLQQTEPEGDEPRLVMHEMIREYALECLEKSGEAAVIQRAHITYYLALVEEAETELTSGEQGRWLRRLEREQENLRAALHRLIEQEEWEMAMRLVGALRIWWARGHQHEGRNFLGQVLSRSQNTEIFARAKALNAAGMLAAMQSDFDEAEELCRESLLLSRKREDIKAMATSLWILGQVAMERANYAEARRLGEESLALSRKVGNGWEAVCALGVLVSAASDQGQYGRARELAEEMEELSRKADDPLNAAQSRWFSAFVEHIQGDFARARTLSEESCILFKEGGDTRGIAYSLLISGSAIWFQGEQARARSLLEESLVLFKKVGDLRGIAWGIYSLGGVTLFEGDPATACTLYKQSLALLKEIGHQVLITLCLDGLASAVSLQSHPVWAARLWGAAEALRQTIGASMPLAIRTLHEQLVTATMLQLGERTFSAAWAEGRTMTLEQVLAAQGPATVSMPTHTEPLSTPPAKPPAPYPAGLTAREVEVLRLVAGGLTDAQVAEHLVISSHTVNTHLKAIYGKIGVSSRSAATRYAMEHQLA